MFEELYKKSGPYLSFEEVLEEAKKLRKKIYSEEQEYRKNNGKLPPNAVVDMEKSVRWNREKVARRNKQYASKMAKYSKRLNEVDAAVSEDIRTRLKEQYDFSDRITNMVFARAYEQSHAWGENEVYLTAQDICEFLQDVFSAAQQEV